MPMRRTLDYERHCREAARAQARPTIDHHNGGLPPLTCPLAPPTPQYHIPPESPQMPDTPTIHPMPNRPRATPETAGRGR